MKKALVVFYTYSGNTEKVAQMLADELSARYETDTVRLEALDESGSFLKQCVRAFRKKPAHIKENVPFDVSAYDMIALGTPVWAFGMAPALRTYLQKSRGFAGKRAVCFTTYGSGAGKQKCINEVVEVLKDKGAGRVSTFSVQQGDISKKEILAAQLRESLGNE